MALVGTFDINFNFDTNYINFDDATYANVPAIQAAYEASNAGQSGNFFDMMKVSGVQWNAATGDLTITLAFGTDAAKIPVPELEANMANFMSVIKLTLPEGALSVPQSKFVAGQVFTTVGTISGGMDIWWQVLSTFNHTVSIMGASATVTAANLYPEYNLAGPITTATSISAKLGSFTIPVPAGTQYPGASGYSELPITFSPLQRPEVQIEMLKPEIIETFVDDPEPTPPIDQDSSVLMSAPNTGLRF